MWQLIRRLLCLPDKDEVAMQNGEQELKKINSNHVCPTHDCEADTVRCDYYGNPIHKADYPKHRTTCVGETGFNRPHHHGHQH